MIYCADLYYFWDDDNFDRAHAIIVTARFVGGLCGYYYAETIPLENGTKREIRKGTLPKDLNKKRAFIENLTTWVTQNSGVPDELFILYFSEVPIEENPSKITSQKPRKWPKFEHHDDTCCWILRLTKEEFLAFQNFLSKNKLPTNLFYHTDQGICLPVEPKGKIGTFLKKLFPLRSYKCYTPMQYKMMNEEPN